MTRATVTRPRSGRRCFSLTQVLGYIVLDYGFDLAGRIPIAPGRYDLRDTVASFYTSQNRPVSAFSNASRQRIWDGDVSALTVGLALKGGSHLRASASYTGSDFYVVFNEGAPEEPRALLGRGFAAKLSYLVRF